MSARFFKIFSGVFVAHLVLLSVVWVGFPVPGPRIAAAFIYDGALPASQDSGNAAPDVGQKPRKTDQVPFDRFEASYFNHWIELRDPSKS